MSCFVVIAANASDFTGNDILLFSTTASAVATAGAAITSAINDVAFFCLFLLLAFFVLGCFDATVLSTSSLSSLDASDMISVSYRSIGLSDVNGSKPLFYLAANRKARLYVFYYFICNFCCFTRYLRYDLLVVVRVRVSSSIAELGLSYNYKTVSSVYLPCFVVVFVASFFCSFCCSYYFLLVYYFEAQLLLIVIYTLCNLCFDKHTVAVYGLS